MWRRHAVGKPHSDVLRFYIYVSDAKVDMLLAQIPPHLLKRLAAEVTVNLKLLSVKLSTRDVESRYSRANVVTRYLEQQQLIGAANNSKQYFMVHGALMRWGVVGRNSARDSPGIVFFAGEVDEIFVYLTGSPHHVIGAAQTALVSGHPGSYRPPMDLWWDVFRDWDTPQPTDALPWNWGREFAKGLEQGGFNPGPERLTFVARRIGEIEAEGKRVIFGSPVWVAVTPQFERPSPALEVIEVDSGGLARIEQWNNGPSEAEWVTVFGASGWLYRHRAQLLPGGVRTSATVPPLRFVDGYKTEQICVSLACNASEDWWDCLQRSEPNARTDRDLSLCLGHEGDPKTWRQLVSSS
jgi:hypothetical protein